MALRGVKKVRGLAVSSKWRRINRRLYIMDNIYKTKTNAEKRMHELRKQGYIAFLGEWRGKHIVLKRRKGTASTILHGIVS